MDKKNRRTQILLTEKQYRKLKDLSRDSKKSLGSLIRDAINTVYISGKKNKDKIVEDIGNMNLPTGNWQDIKREIVEGNYKKQDGRR